MLSLRGRDKFEHTERSIICLIWNTTATTFPGKATKKKKRKKRGNVIFNKLQIARELFDEKWFEPIDSIDAITCPLIQSLTPSWCRSRFCLCCSTRTLSDRRDKRNDHGKGNRREKSSLAERQKTIGFQLRAEWLVEALFFIEIASPAH